MNDQQRAAMQMQSYLNSVFDYKEGKLYWKEAKSRCIKAGDEAGCVDKSTGYVKVSLDGKSYGAHRLIFVMHYGYLPKNVDHKNQVRSDNRIENLRAATVANNAQNSKMFGHNTSGVKGVCWSKSANKYQAMITVDGKRIYLGYYSQIDDAAKAISNARHKYHGEFASHG
jgi:hypothetical protein